MRGRCGGRPAEMGDLHITLASNMSPRMLEQRLTGLRLTGGPSVDLMAGYDDWREPA